MVLTFERKLLDRIRLENQDQGWNSHTKEPLQLSSIKSGLQKHGGSWDEYGKNRQDSCGNVSASLSIVDDTLLKLWGILHTWAKLECYKNVVLYV